MNFRDTVVTAGAKASASGLTCSKIGGSAGEKAETGGVIPVVEREERDELDERSGNAPRLGLGVRDRARPDFWPNDREIELMLARLWCSPELIRLCALPPAAPMLPIDDGGRDFLPSVEIGIPNGSSASTVGIDSSETAFFCPSVGRSASVAARARSGCEADRRGMRDSSLRTG